MPTTDETHLGATATDIDVGDSPIVVWEDIRAGDSCLLPAGNDLDIDARLGEDTLGNLLTVGSLTESGGSAGAHIRLVDLVEFQYDSVGPHKVD